MNKKKKKSLSSIELFAGAGGMALGAEMAGFKHIMLNEIDKYAVMTLKKNRPNWNVIHSPIENILEDSKKFKGKIDFIAGGFPCQSFSYAGKRLGLEDARGTLFYSYAKYIKNVEPNAFLIENVKGLISHDGGKTFNLIKNTLTELGYFIDWKILNSNNYDVAQKRERVIIIGFKNEELFKKFKWPLESLYKPVLRDVLVDVPLSDGYKYPESKKRVMDLVPQGGCWRDLPDDIAREYMKKSYYLGGGKTGMARRISWDEPSLTLTTSPMQMQTERCHPDETRPFTVREYARIQSFPDSWKFEGPISAQYKQIGNAVPVNMINKVMHQIYLTLSEATND